MEAIRRVVVLRFQNLAHTHLSLRQRPPQPSTIPTHAARQTHAPRSRRWFSLGQSRDHARGRVQRCRVRVRGDAGDRVAGVPRTSGELLATMRGFGPFVVTFLMLAGLWYSQFTFFRRYGLEDRVTVR